MTRTWQGTLMGLLVSSILVIWGGVGVDADEGAAAAAAHFSASATRVATGDVVVFRASESLEPPAFYQWDVDGDGDVDVVSGTSAIDVMYADGGVYAARLTTIDGKGRETVSESVSISVANRAPEVAISVQGGMLRAGVAVSFGGSAWDSDGSIARWAWSFGDGTSSGDEGPAHVYASAGTYTVRLAVVDDDGATSSAEILQIVVEDAPPSASFYVSESGTSSLGVVFVDTTTGAQRESIASVGWDFGDGTYTSGAPSSSDAYVHAYREPGLYSVTFYVIDRLGTLSTSNQSVWIRG